MRWLRRLLWPWFPSLPPWLGATLEALIMCTLLAVVNLRRPFGRQVLPLVVTVLVYAFFSYGARIKTRHQPKPRIDEPEEQK